MKFVDAQPSKPLMRKPKLNEIKTGTLRRSLTTCPSLGPHFAHMQFVFS